MRIYDEIAKQCQSVAILCRCSDTTFDVPYVLHFFNYNSRIFYGKLVLCITIKSKK